MPIFSVKNSSLGLISEKKIDLERDIQKLTEQNLKTIFGLKFVSGSLNQEFFIRAQEQDFYIDTLAFDETTNAFVIIEYKKDKSISVIDQGFAYLSAMLNHKADFILEINERLEKTLTKKDIDWEQSRVIFISPEFTNYQKNAINFKDLPIFLYKVTMYENNILEYDPIRPYRTTESIGMLSKDKTIQAVSKEVRVYSEDDLLNKVKKAKELYETLKDAILLIDDALIFHSTKTYVGIQMPGNWRILAAINFRQNQLIVDYTRSKPKDFDDPEKKLVYKTNSIKHFGQYISTLVIDSNEDAKYAAFLFKQSYRRFIDHFGK